MIECCCLGERSGWNELGEESWVEGDPARGGAVLGMHQCWNRSLLRLSASGWMRGSRRPVRGFGALLVRGGTESTE